MKIKSVHNEIFIFDLCKMLKPMNIPFKAFNKGMCYSSIFVYAFRGPINLLSCIYVKGTGKLKK